MLQIAIIGSCLLVLLALIGAHFSGGPDEVGAPPAGSARSKEQKQVSLAIRNGAPPRFARSYVSAARANDLPWQLLAAIGSAESDHGRSPLPGVRTGINLAGCCAGPMQICITEACGNVAAAYAVDGDRNRKFSIYSPPDAVWTAARYLKWMTSLVGDDPRILAAAYNAGPTIVSEVGIPPYPETRAYVDKVTGYMNRTGL